LAESGLQMSQLAQDEVTKFFEIFFDLVEFVDA
jgi:hypothetical protein